MKFLGKIVGGVAKLKVVWKEWDVRSFIVASFVFQLILILFAPFRKRSSSRYLLVSTWLSYLLADWVAAQAVGLIAKVTQASDSAESDLFGLWAQFLLVHLGGPDTITALALEDNELWIRTALHLGKGKVVSLQKERLLTEDILPDEIPSVKLAEEEEKELRWIKESFGIVTNLESIRGPDRVNDALWQLDQVYSYIEAEGKWEVLGRVWVELVCYAAITCRPNVHAARLKEGGEFLTFVWLLMVHLGFEARTFA